MILMSMNLLDTAEATATMILEIVPRIMQTIRVDIRRSRASDLTVVQQRVLNFLRSHPGCSLVDLADHIGLTASTASVLVDGLLQRGLLLRSESPQDRRRIELHLNETGACKLEEAVAGARASLMRRLEGLTAEQHQLVQQALVILSPIDTLPDIENEDTRTKN
jgi:DNA-binding MarR family transcriptional regulator